MVCVNITFIPLLSLQVPGPVTSLRVASPSSTQLRLSWQRSTRNTCTDNNYEIRYQLLKQGQCELSPSNLQYANPWMVDALTTTVVSLLPYSLYNVSVAVRNEAGVGESVYVTGTTQSSSE